MCRNTRKTFQINKHRRIGKVLIIVEGEKAEVKCFKEIFNRIFGYKTMHVTQKNNVTVYKNYSASSNSTIIIANTEGPSIKTILEPNHREKIINAAQSTLGESIKNCRTYYVWDRDNVSNTPKDVQKAIEQFHNAQGNEELFENGLLLLSYLCYEAFLISNFEGDLDFVGMHPKKYIKGDKKKKYKPTNFSEKTLSAATEIMKNKLINMRIKLDYDDMKKVNQKIYSKEELIYKKREEYRLLSEISIMLLDLGLIEEVLVE